MKIFKKLICLMILLVSSVFCFVACNKPKDDLDGNLTLTEAKDFALNDSIFNWTSLSASRKDNNGNRKTIINKKVSNNQTTLDYIYESDNEKVYCEDGVRYYDTDTRDYIDSSEFDEEKFIEDVINECLSEMYNLFNNDSNSLYYANKEIKNGETHVTLKFDIDKNNNTILIAEIVLKENNIINITINIDSNIPEDEVDVKLEESDIKVNSLKWFDMNDFKEEMTYNQVRDIVLDVNLFDNWTSVYASFPNELTKTENEIYFSEENNELVLFDTRSVDNVSNNIAYVDGREYRYKNDNPDRLISSHYDDINFDYVMNYLSESAYKFFFYDEEGYGDCFVTAKHYEKERDIVSFKFEYDEDGLYQVFLGNLYFDLTNELYMIETYFKAIEDGVVVAEFERKLQKLDGGVSQPEWFDVNDFANFVDLIEIQNKYSSVNINNWRGYNYTGEINFEGSEYLSNGVHFKEKAEILKVGSEGSYIDYNVEKYVSAEALALYDYDKNTYPFWKSDFNKNMYLYSKDKTELVYDVDNKQSYLNSTASYTPTYFNSYLYGILNSMMTGNFKTSFALPVHMLTNEEWLLPSNMYLPGQSLLIMRCLKSTTNIYTKYSIQYEVEGDDSIVYFTLNIYFDKQDNFYKVEMVSNLILPIANATTKIVLRQSETITSQPSWFEDAGLVKHRIVSGSMEPTLKVGFTYFAIKVDDYKVGDIVVMDKGEVILVHRIIRIEEVDDVTYYITKGDASDTEDGRQLKSEFIGKIIWT